MQNHLSLNVSTIVSDIKLMDQKLLDAARTGDMGVLDGLLAEDPQLLERVSLGFCSESPLHIAVLAGPTNFVKEIIRRKPVLAKEMNKDGFSPLHMAATNGHIDIVKELLMSPLGYKLCSIKDNLKGRTALHCAVIKGRVAVVSELLSASLDSVQEITSRGETVLHLAVKNNQFEAFKTMMEKNIGIKEILNTKDRDGNTVLHLAISKRQHRIIELLLGRETVGKLEVNAKSAMNLTALDILVQSSSEWSDIQIGEILRHAGALRTEAIPKQITSQAPPAHNIQPVHHQTSAPTKEPLVAEKKSFVKEYCNELFREIEDSPSETRNSLMVVAILIATLTYQGALYPPGGVWQDSDIHHSTMDDKPMIHHAGKAIMASETSCYILYLVFNTVGFLTSLIIISLLTSRFPLTAWLRLAVVSMGSAFGCGIFFISGFKICARVFLLLFFCAAILRWKYWWIEKWAIVKDKRRMSNGLDNEHPTFMQRIVQYIASRAGSVAPNNTV